MQAISAATATAASARAIDPRLVKAAHEFEAQMMKELIKPLNGGSALNGSDLGKEEDAGSASALGEFASEALGRALSEGGGFGIAASILKRLSPPGNQNGTIPVTGNLRGNTEMKKA